MAVVVPVSPSYFQFDQQGVVFNMWYFAWFDDAMAQFLGEAGYPYQAMIADGLDVQLVHTEADWREGVRWGESVLIDVVTEKIGSTSFTMSFAVRVGSQLRSTGRTVYVVVATDGSGKQPVPSKLRAALESARLSSILATGPGPHGTQHRYSVSTIVNVCAVSGVLAGRRAASDLTRQS